MFEPPEEIRQAALNGNLVMFVGAGVSMLVGMPSWKGLASAALEDLRSRLLLNYSEIDQLKILNPRKQLSIAELIAKEHGQTLDFPSYLNARPGVSEIYASLNAIGCPCVTTNYDGLLEPRSRNSAGGSTTPSPTRRIAERRKFFSNLLDSPGTVVHLHGAVSEPETMVVTTRDYLEHYDDENVRTFLGELFERKTVLFIGYGLEEAEILEHILRRGRAKGSDTRSRFALHGFFQSQTPLYRSLHNYYEKSFGVHLLGFLRDHDDYGCQAQLMELWSQKLEVRRPPLAADAELIDEVLGNV